MGAAPSFAAFLQIVCKPSEVTPVTAFFLAKILHELNFPKGVFNMVHGFGASVGSALWVCVFPLPWCLDPGIRSMA